MDPLDEESPPVWDEDAALAIVGGDRTLALNLLQGLCATLPQELELLHEHQASADLAGTAERAHHISGGAAYCGVLALRSRLRLLESRARAGDMNGTRTALSAVEAEVDRLLTLASDLG
jgi:HPt (histidine-containing phosphotransfer) domain-containing protein